MNLEEYKSYWYQNNEVLYVVNTQQADKIKVDRNTYVFITEWGLPANAAPFLSFDEFLEEEFLSVNEYLGINRAEMDSFLVFGTNGSGDPVCIDINSANEIVGLNHDNNLEQTYMNKSILKFALCLIRYQQFITLTKDNSNTNGGKKFSDQSFEKLKNDLKDIDETCLAANSFWASELEGLLWDRAGS